MNISVICLLLIAMPCLPARSNSAELAVSIEIIVEPQEGLFEQIVIDGRTNLPPITKLNISISECVRVEPRGSTEAYVLSDGTLKSKPLGPEAGLRPGNYLAVVRAQVTKWQPESVRKSVGDNGELLAGPHVEKDRSRGVSAT